MDSSQLCQKHAEERSEQPFASDAGVVHKLEVLSSCRVSFNSARVAGHENAISSLSRSPLPCRDHLPHSNSRSNSRKAMKLQ